MSSTSFKGSNLTVGGPALDKSKLQLRRPTPDSDVLASSDDDKDHGRPPIRPAFAGGRRLSSTGWSHQVGSLRKNSLPSTSFADTQSASIPFEQARPIFSWSGSFGSSQSGSRFKDIVPSPTSSDRPQPSPTSTEIDPGIHFLLNQQQPPPRKSVRSQSYSIGQGDIENSPVGKFSAHLRSNLRHKPSKPSMLGDSTPSLAQLREDDADETGSNGSDQHGVRLPLGYWERENQQTLLKQAVVARNRATSATSPQPPHRRKTTAGLRNIYGTDYAIDEQDDTEYSMEHPSVGLTRRFSEQVALLPREQEPEIIDSPKKPQWATNNIPMLGSDAMGRRHSFAHYGSHSQGFAQPKLSNTQEVDEELELEYDPDSPRLRSHSPEQEFDASAYFAGYGPASRAINASAISAAHPDPVVPNPSMSAGGNPYAVPSVLGRPGRRLFVVTFKCSRADIYYLYDNTGLEIRRGDLVMVEGDRGVDLGQVTYADVSLEEARKQKAAANEEHFRWLVMFSQYSLAGTTNDSGMLGSLARANGLPNAMAGPGTNTVGNPDQQDAKPKMIKRLAQQHEIMTLRDKEGAEAKAKRLGAQKAADHKLPMEILDAEYQADHHKLTYYYYADTYVNFNELVTDLFKQYKVRIWMSAVNPASVINPAGIMSVQPPSAIGPGAIVHNAGRPQGVGYGFGNNNNNNNNNNHRGNYGGRSRQQPAPRQDQGQGNYDDGYNAFSQQLPNYGQQTNYSAQTSYNSQPSYAMPPWAAQNQQMFMQPGQYPTATASGSPMNYPAYYPPSTYGASSGYRGGYSSSSAAGVSQSYTTTAGPSYNQHPSQMYAAANANPLPEYLNRGSPANSKAKSTASGASYNPAFDPTLMTGMQNLGFGK